MKYLSQTTKFYRKPSRVNLLTYGTGGSTSTTTIKTRQKRRSRVPVQIMISTDHGYVDRVYSPDDHGSFQVYMAAIRAHFPDAPIKAWQMIDNRRRYLKNYTPLDAHKTRING